MGDIVGSEYFDEEGIEKEIDEDAIYEQWREDGAEDFDNALKELIWDYVKKQNHYMNSKGHIIMALHSQADYLDSNWNSFEEMMKKRDDKE